MLRKQVLPMVATRGLVVFPSMVIHFDIARRKSIAALERCMEIDQEVFLCAQIDMDVENPSDADLYRVGTIARVKQVLKLPGNTIRVLVEGVARASIMAFLKREPYFETLIDVYEEENFTSEELMVQEAYMRRIKDQFLNYATVSPQISAETISMVQNMSDAGRLADTVASHVLTSMEDRQQILECISIEERLKSVTELLVKETELQKIDHEIQKTVKTEIEQHQKELFLREQMRAIQKELGENGSPVDDLYELEDKIKYSMMPDEAREKCLKEISRLSMMSPGSPEATVSRTYVDTMLELPWGVYTKDNLDLVNARKILDEDHYGLVKLKERIIEFLAVRKLRNDMKGPILCFVGPPGVGKTSIAKSIARALDKKFVRMSLGGVHDEAEIRGHRRTYIGSVPGRVITSIKQAGSMNPLFLFDEIDKMASDFRGDPASAMLEVLDPEINNTFADHYLDTGFDLSKVMFVTTANDPSEIPAPLYDRMEIIEFSSYLDVEKLQIAKRHIIPKQLKEHGLEEGQVRIADSAVMDMIHDYTAESGVRQLEREIAAVMRKSAVSIVNGKKTKVSVVPACLKGLLGLPKHTDTVVPKENTKGVAIGLAWTTVGGQTLPVEVSLLEGTGKLELTGQLGDVMKESARTGFSVVRSLASEYGIRNDINEKCDIHIHCPEGAVPKDGPSAGVTMITAMVSAFTGRKVRCDVAMTGEITLTGRVLKIGGLKEKTLAALRAGVTDVIVPEDNKADIEELPKSVRSKLTFHFVSDVKSVLEIALEK